MNTFKTIDESTWDRAIHCSIFRNSLEPAFCITFEVDVTGFKKKMKEQNLSFTLGMVHTVSKIANEIEAFRYRFYEGKIVLFDQIDIAFTYLNPKTELFKVVNVPFKEDLIEYINLAKKTAEKQDVYFTGPLGIDVFQCSPLPWINYTHISHTNSGKKDNATPLFDWGKFHQKDEKFIMPLSSSSSFLYGRNSYWRIYG